MDPSRLTTRTHGWDARTHGDGQYSTLVADREADRRQKAPRSTTGRRAAVASWRCQPTASQNHTDGITAFELVDTIEKTDRFETEFNFYQGAQDNLWENDVLSGEHTEA